MPHDPQPEPPQPQGEDAFLAALRTATAGLGLLLTDPQVSAMWRHFCAIVRQNQVMNLTRITDPADAAVKHYADSLAVLAWVSRARPAINSVLDVGTGAGFPAVPTAIVRPDWRVAAIDGTRKKIDFIRRVIGELDLANLRAEHAHSSHWETDRRASTPPATDEALRGRGSWPNRFDLVVLRAVAKLDEAIESSARFVADAGWLVVYKTADIPTAESAAGRAAAGRAGLVPSERFEYRLEQGPDPLLRALYVYGRAGKPGRG